jgi:hypothetical protein
MKYIKVRLVKFLFNTFCDRNCNELTILIFFSGSEHNKFFYQIEALHLLGSRFLNKSTKPMNEVFIVLLGILS